MQHRTFEITEEAETGELLLPLDLDTLTILRDIEAMTAIPSVDLIAKLLGAHMAELSEFHYWLTSNNCDSVNKLGADLINAYGPDTLIDAIRKAAPSHTFQSEVIATAGSL